MRGKMSAKLKSRAGETIAETLIALLISALALLMLAGAVSAAASMVTRSNAKMTEYYTADKALAEYSGGRGGEEIVIENGNETTDLTGPQSLNVTWFENPTFGGNPVVSYKKVDVTSPTT